MQRTSITWTQLTSNPIHFIVKGDPVREKARKGWLCTKVSKGCTNCYSETINFRYGNKLPYNQTSSDRGEWVFYESEPLEWAGLEEPSMIFVCDMTDLFHPGIPNGYRDKMFSGMEVAPWHTFQVLTKRPEEALSYYGARNESSLWNFPSSLWLGATVESPDYVDRLDVLRKIPAKTRFVSFEPLLEDIGEVNLKGIDWIIVGAESGNKRRPFDLEWAYNLLDQARLQNVKYFFKQTSGLYSGSLEGVPEDLIVREFPVEV